MILLELAADAVPMPLQTVIASQADKMQNDSAK
jgi:hypothetical protein